MTGTFERPIAPVARAGEWRERRRRLSSTVLRGREEAMVAAFDLDAETARQGGVWRWDLAADRVSFSGGAARLVADLAGEVSTRAPVFLSHMPVRHRHAVLAALGAALARGTPIEVDVWLGDELCGARVRLSARPAPGQECCLIGTLRRA